MKTFVEFVKEVFENVPKNPKRSRESYDDGDDRVHMYSKKIGGRNIQTLIAHKPDGSSNITWHADDQLDRVEPRRGGSPPKEPSRTGNYIKSLSHVMGNVVHHLKNDKPKKITFRTEHDPRHPNPKAKAQIVGHIINRHAKKHGLESTVTPYKSGRSTGNDYILSKKS